MGALTFSWMSSHIMLLCNCKGHFLCWEADPVLDGSPAQFIHISSKEKRLFYHLQLGRAFEFRFTDPIWAVTFNNLQRINLQIKLCFCFSSLLSEQVKQ